MYAFIFGKHIARIGDKNFSDAYDYLIRPTSTTTFFFLRQIYGPRWRVQR